MAQTQRIAVEMVRKGQIWGILDWTASHEDVLIGLIVLEMGLGPSLLLWVSCLALFLSHPTFQDILVAVPSSISRIISVCSLDDGSMEG